jgi:exopolyphosphatase/guanosine-5'-triphosphate,3'-diphosphate pyrophosphatase
MQRDQYPLNIVHQHTLTVRQGIDIAQFLSIAPPSSLVRHAVPKKRVELVHYAALVMERVLTLAKPRSLIFSGYGLRDGLIYDRLDARERAKDPLLAACAHLVGSPAYGEHVFHWSSTLFAAETSEQARLRHAACLLSEVGARDHAVHRAESAYERVLYMQSGGLDHAARAFLAYTLYRRNEGPADTRAGKSILNTVEQLIAMPALRAAERIGAVLDFAGTFSGGVAALLDRAGLSILEGTLILTCDEEGMSLLTETIRKQFAGLAKHLHLKPVVRQS